MSTYILMKILEASPNRYDRGIHLLTLGRLEDTYDRLTEYVKPGQKVLDIGCGTGALSLRAAMRGAEVKGIDINSQMLEIARKKVNKADLAQSVTLVEMGVAELDSEISESFDVVMSGLCFSELSEDELNYTLKEIKRILKAGGLLLIADESVPKNPVKKAIHGFMRVPLAAVTYILTQTRTKAVRDLPERLEKEGFIVESVRFNKMEDLIEIAARKPKRG